MENTKMSGEKHPTFLCDGHTVSLWQNTSWLITERKINKIMLDEQRKLNDEGGH